MVEIARRAEWNLTFDLFGTETIGAVNFTRAEAEINFVLCGANGVAMIFERLLEAKLRVGGGLKLVERDSNNTDWAW